MANLEELRKEMDRVDDQFVALFGERMQVAGRIAEYKRAQNLPVLNAQREREKLADVASKSVPELAEYIRSSRRHRRSRVAASKARLRSRRAKNCSATRA